MYMYTESDLAQRGRIQKVILAGCSNCPGVFTSTEDYEAHDCFAVIKELPSALASDAADHSQAVQDAHESDAQEGDVSDQEREITDLKQAESFLLEHGLSGLPIIPMPQHRKTLNWIARVWWRVRERRLGIEAGLEHAAPAATPEARQ